MNIDDHNNDDDDDDDDDNNNSTCVHGIGGVGGCYLSIHMAHTLMKCGARATERERRMSIRHNAMVQSATEMDSCAMANTMAMKG